jgi:glycosyltransferase involved in cell wall biosynthesis
MMKVALLLSCSSFEGFFGRVQKQTKQTYLETYRNDWSWYYASGLLENGIKPVLYVPSLNESGLFATDVEIDVRFLPVARWYKLIDRVRLKQIIRQSRWSLYLDERINTISFMKPLQQALLEDEIGHLYIQEYWSGRFDHLASHLDLPVSGADHGGLSTGVVKWFKRKSFEKASICFGQTKAECRLIERYGGKSKFQPNGCNVSRFRPNPAILRQKTVLTVARLTDKQKRTSDLISAIRHLPEEWSLDIVGTGPDKAKLERLAAQLGLGSRVRFHGFLGHDDVRDLLWRCGAYAMPSDNEAVAIAALEAMGCGAPVVLSRIRSFEELVEDGVNGRLVPVGDVESLAAAILHVWEHRDAMGKAASETVRTRYDTQVLYRELADTLRASTTMA